MVPVSETSLTRRDAIKGAVGLAALGAFPAGAAGSDRREPGRERVAIIGAGAGGVAAAYFLAGSFDVDLFEARSRIGGHCDSRVIKHRGRRIIVDLGAQFFHPDTHPIYVTLLEELGLYDPEHPDDDATLQAPASLCIFPDGRWRAHLLVDEPARDAAARGRLCDVHATRAAGGSVEHVVGDHRRRLDPQPALGAGRQEGRPVSVDHGDDRVHTRRRAPSIGAVDPADVRAGVSVQPCRGCHHIQLEDRASGEPAAHAGPQPERPGSSLDARASPKSHERRLVRADAGGPQGALPVRGVERASACWTRTAASAARLRRRHCVAGRVQVLRLTPSDSHRSGLRAPRSPQLGGLQRRGRRS